MLWYSPPTRREVSLILFSLTTFVLFYNLEVSFTSSSEREVNNKDDKSNWDEVIYGNWTWEEQQVAENARKHAHHKPTNDPVAISFHPHVFGTVGVNDGALDWRGAIPTTTVLKHVPGAWGWAVCLRPGRSGVV